METHWSVKVTLLGRCLLFWVVLVAEALGGHEKCKKPQRTHTCVEGYLHELRNRTLSCLGNPCQRHAAPVSTCFNCPKIGISGFSESSIAQSWYWQTQQNMQMLFPRQLAHFNIWQAHAIFFILHFLAQLRTLKPPYYNAILSETRAIRCIYYVYSVFLTVVTIQYTEISHRCRGTHVAWWALGNVTTCHIGHLKMPFHGPSLPILSTYH